MRDYHFRAWDKAKGKWIDGAYGFHILGESMLIGGLFQDYKIEDLNNIVIEQFTGLLDKQGKEIYEGDIIKWNLKSLINAGNKIQHDGDITKVVWRKEIACFGLEKTGKYGFWTFYEDMDIEIIGNIHETPKLLETERKNHA